MSIHLNIEDLLSARTIETERIEFKKGWNPDAIYRSICAFANDFDNTGGGYILIGVEEDEQTRIAKRPIVGLTTADIAMIQQKMIGFNNLLQPVYHPHLYIESADEKQFIILWVPGGSNRPYKVPEKITAKEKRYYFYIRKYANTIKASLAEEQELISLANIIPFDDRVNTSASLNSVSILLIKDHLQKIKSRLAEQVGVISDQELLLRMELISGPNEHPFLRNVGLMMFSEYPEKFFPYSQVEIVDFPNGDAEAYIEHEPITGPVPEQINRTLKFIKDKLIREKVIKPVDKAESIRIYSYPYQALEEVVVNAFYHRDYQQREPIEIRIYPNSIIIINHGGPDRSIRMESFNMGTVRSRRYRNRRLGEFLKELELTEGRATGIPTILKNLKVNGSPAPRFYTDEERTFFEVELFIHPEFKAKYPFIFDTSKIKPNSESVGLILDELFEYFSMPIIQSTESEQAGVIGSEQAESINNLSLNLDIQIDTFAASIDNTTMSAIVSAIVSVIDEKERGLLTLALQAHNRPTLLATIGVSNHQKNYNNYMLPLVKKGWLSMTIPDKPTSPNQKYITTTKGRLLLKILETKKN